MLSGLFHDVLRMFSGCSDGSCGPGGSRGSHGSSGFGGSCESDGSAELGKRQRGPPSKLFSA